MKKIYVFCGKARHGKDTSAEFVLADNSIHHVFFAKHLKDIATNLGWNGEKDVKGRTFLQEIGDVMKHYHGEGYFSQVLCEQIKTLIKKGAEKFVITDLRFKEEMTFLKNFAKQEGIEIQFIKVFRPNFDNGLTPEQKNHRSETDLDDEAMTTIINDGSLDDLKAKVLNLINRDIQLPMKSFETLCNHFDVRGRMIFEANPIISNRGMCLGVTLVVNNWKPEYQPLLDICKKNFALVHVYDGEDETIRVVDCLFRKKYPLTPAVAQSVVSSINTINAQMQNYL